ncbi:DUF6517 family protein [Haloarchaeobius sp. DFWS5]|uniref:DUF6517 family protein n=1 Tax=Haloarchaeobius sp. DFWS5 TaxID=3446114 RepID=UPI003EC063F8
MQFSRREFLTTTGVGGLAATAGCVGGLLSGEQSAEATAATVGADVLAQTSYEHLGTDPQTLTHTFEIEGQEQTVTLTNYLSTYQKLVSLPGIGKQPAATFVALASPTVEVFGQSLNPLGELKKEALAKRAQQTYGTMRIEEHLGNQQVQALGAARELARFAGVATLAGVDFDVRLELGTARHAGDVVVLFGGYPADLQREAENVLALVQGISH